MSAVRRKGRRTGAGLVAAAAVAAVLWLAFAGHAPGHPQMAGYQRHPMAVAVAGTRLPDYAKAPPDLPRLYTFAVEHPEILSYVPCTCGCAANGHHSNWNCYVKGVASDGTVVFDPMAPT